MSRWTFLALIAPVSAFAGEIDFVPGDYPTIQAAIDQGTAPVIQVAPGSWAGGRVTRAVTIEGEAGASITSGPKFGGMGVGFALDSRSSGSEITGFTFACGVSDQLDVGVYGSTTRLGSAAHDVRVGNNTFRGCVQGVTNAGRATSECRPKTVSGGDYWLIEQNTFDGIRSVADNGNTTGGIGIYLFNAPHADVLENSFVGKVQDTRAFTTGGVILAGCRDCTVAGNAFTITGGTSYFSAVSNLGYLQSGAAASERLLIADNDATRSSAPQHGINFRSFDSFSTSFDNNGGVAFIDHTACGDDELDTFEGKFRR